MAIVELKDQVCSLDHALKLKELGVIQNSLFLYCNGYKNPRGEKINDGEVIISASEKLRYTLNSRKRGDERECTFASAYTLSELLALVPLKFRRVYYANFSGKFKPTREIASIANHLLFLLNSKFVSVDEINDRFKPDNFES